MFGYDFRKGQDIILCSLGAEIAAAAHFPLFLFRPIGTLSWLRTGGSRRRDNNNGLGAMTTAKPRPPLAPGESRAYPVLALRDIVVFPHMIAPLFVGRKKSILALEEVIRSDTFILLATQKNASDDDPATEAIYEIGTLASVLQLLKLPDGTVKVLVEGAQRAKMVSYTDRSESLSALGHRRVRELREAQQEGAARGSGRRPAD